MKRWLVALGLAWLALSTSACGEPGHEHEGGEHAEEHGHGHGGGIVRTTFTDTTELFVEFAPLVLGQESAFAAHLTWLSDFRPVGEGTATVVLAGGGAPEERFTAEVGDTAGIFRPVAKPAHAGVRELRLELDVDGRRDVHDLGSMTVYADAADVHEHAEDDEGAIAFLKEQQWKMEFATARVEVRELRATLPVFANVRARPDAEVLVNAPADGRLLAGDPLPIVGSKVEAGERMVMLAPALGPDTDLASLDLVVELARVELDHAERELVRVQDLRDRGATSDSRVAEAALERDRALAELASARRRVRQFRRLQKPGGEAFRGTIEVPAPIAGTVMEVSAVAGSFVESGDELFRIVDPSRLWIAVRVPEFDLAALDELAGAWVWFDERESTFLDSDAIVSKSGPVDPRTRAVSVFLRVPDSFDARIGAALDVELALGQPRSVTAIPTCAIVWENGLPYVFVELGGESFERRQVWLGTAEAAWVEVITGVESGERIVTVGADLVALAAAAPATAGHGHPH
jgi:cobalt-zinc-cadmium efflux system membrane fusion protein